MGSNYFGNLSLGNERSPPTNSSSRKGKKSSSDKPPKQPQRGLGVAQLEQIRLHSQIGDSTTYLPPSNHYFASPTNVSQEDSRWRTPYSSSPSLFSCSSSSSSSSFGFPVQQQCSMMGLNEMGNIRFPDSVHQRTPISRWNHDNDILESQYLGQPSITSHYFLNQQEEDLVDERRMKVKIDSLGSNEDQELDLELRLAL